MSEIEIDKLNRSEEGYLRGFNSNLMFWLAIGGNQLKWDICISSVCVRSVFAWYLFQFCQNKQKFYHIFTCKKINSTKMRNKFRKHYRVGTNE